MLYQQPGPHHRKIYRNGRRAGKNGSRCDRIERHGRPHPPAQASTIIGGLKARLSIPVWIHTHDTAGLGAGTYMAAIDAGVDAIDLSIAPFANGTGQPDTTRMLALLEGHARCPEVSEAQNEALRSIRQHLETIYQELGDFTSRKNELVDIDTLEYQVPGGMLSNFRTQLKEQKMEDKFDEVFQEIPVVREAIKGKLI